MDGITNQLNQFINTTGTTTKPAQANNKFAELVFESNPEQSDHLDRPMAKSGSGAVFQSSQEVVRTQDFFAHIDVAAGSSVSTQLPIMEHYESLQPDKSIASEFVPQIQLEGKLLHVSEPLHIVESMAMLHDSFRPDDITSTKSLSEMNDHEKTLHVSALPTIADIQASESTHVDIVNTNQNVIMDLNNQIVTDSKSNESAPPDSFEKFADYSEAETAVTTHSAVSEGGNAVKVVSASELYDQKWYSIGKLSYIDSDIQTLAKTITEQTSGTTDTLMEFESRNLINDTSVFEYSSQSSASDAFIASSNYAQSNTEVFRESKKYVSLATSAVLNQLHEIEKKKISVLKGDEGQTLAVRDYTSSVDTVNEQVNQYVKHYGNSISKITINGKTSN